MKITLLLSALFLSTSAWCASGVPSERVARTVGQNDHSIMIGCMVVIYLAAMTWWTVMAKRSLNNVLKGVLESIAKYR